MPRSITPVTVGYLIGLRPVDPCAPEPVGEPLHVVRPGAIRPEPAGSVERPAVARDWRDALLDAVKRAPIPVVHAPTCRDLEAAIDGPAILAELGANADHGAVTVTVLPCDGGYVVNVRAVAVVTAERAAEIVAGAKADRDAHAAAMQSAPEAITEAMQDGMPMGRRK